MNEQIKKAIEREKYRQNHVINLIASENYASKDIMKIQGSVLTNKYAEGYPGKRYYGGCENVDDLEELAIKYACVLFRAKYANVQPHSGSSANMAVYRALLDHGDKVLGMNLTHGGHLTHGHKINFSGIDYQIIDYKLNEKTELIDYEELMDIALKEKPKMIIAGASAYPRIIDFEKFREIADACGAYLMVDMAHIAGLVAARLHPSPVPYADVVTSTTHKTLRGPRGGLILTNNEDIINKINKTVFPGIQGGPLMHVIAAKAQCFYEASTKEFIEYQKQVLKNIQAMIKVFKDNNYYLVTGGSDNHLLLININKTLGITGAEAQDELEKIGIVVNKNTVPFETLSPSKASGIRIGSPAMTTKGFKEREFTETAEIIVEALNNYKEGKDNIYLKKKVRSLLGD
jgi:glycine hydroxymethyltransferase